MITNDVRDAKQEKMTTICQGTITAYRWRDCKTRTKSEPWSGHISTAMLCLL